MKKAYIFGCGKYLELKYADIASKYEILGVFDNYKEGYYIALDGKKYHITRPHTIDADTMIIFAMWQYRKPRLQCLDLGIKLEQFSYSWEFVPYMPEEQKLLEERQINKSDFLTYCNYIKPLNRTFGNSRGGTPIDRWYLEKWLNSKKNLIKGDVLEIAEDTYTSWFGSNYRSHILHKCPTDNNQIKGDLVTGEGLLDNSLDCMIITQTISYIYDYKAAFYNIKKALKKDGYALITCDGIAQIARYDADMWGYYWRFSDTAITKIAEEVGFSECNIEVFGNVKTACALLYGIVAEELKQEELEYNDKDYPVSICITLKK